MSSTDRDIAQLLDLAGLRPQLSEERARRIRTAVLPAWQSEARSHRRKRQRNGLAITAIAAGLTVALGVMLWNPSSEFAAEIAAVGRVVKPEPRLVRSDGSTGVLSEGVVVRAGDSIATGAGLAALDLGGGKSLRMDAETELRVASKGVFELDRGAIYVDSGDESEGRAGIIVTTPFGVVHEIGTRFEVRVDDESLRVRVREGSVRLATSGATHRAEAERELLVREDGTLTLGTVRTHGPEWDWTLRVAPEFTLERRRLGDFLRWVERETGWSVHYADPTSRAGIEEISIRGPRTAVSPLESLSPVLEACELSFRLEDGTVTISTTQEPGGTE